MEQVPDDGPFVDTLKFVTKKDGQVVTYTDTIVDISTKITDGITYDVILSEYNDEDIESIEHLIKNVFPNYYAFIQEELDDKFKHLLSQRHGPISLDDLKAHNEDEVKKLLKSFGQEEDDFQAFLQDPTGMAFFKETILSHRDIISNTIEINPDEIIDAIGKFLDSTKPNIIIDFDVPNRTFDEEIHLLKAKGVISDDNQAVRPSEENIDELIDNIMGEMDTTMKIITDKYHQNVGRLRQILDDFQPNFLLRLESYLIEQSHGCFKSLPEMFLSFLNDKSPIIAHFSKHMPNVHGFKLNPTYGASVMGGGIGDNLVARIGDRVIITLKNIQNKSNGVSAINQNIMAYKRRTCKSIVASQIRGMNRAISVKVPDGPVKTTGLMKQVKGALLKLADTVISAVENNPLYKSKIAKPASDGASASSSDGASASAEDEGAEVDDEDLNDGTLGFFLDLYRGQLLGSTVKNQEIETSKKTFLWTKPPKCDMRLEMEHIIGVYQASLLFSDKAYYNAIFTNLQIMSRDSNQGVSKMVYMKDKLLYMLPGDEETLNDRLIYLYSRLFCMNRDLADIPTIERRYLPYSSYGPAKTGMKECLLRGVPFRVITEASFQSVLQMASATSKTIQDFKSISSQLTLFHELSLRENKEGLQQLLNELFSILSEPSFHSLPVNTTLLSANFDQQMHQFFKEDGVRLVLDDFFEENCIALSTALFTICSILDEEDPILMMHTTSFADLNRMIQENDTLKSRDKLIINQNIKSIKAIFKKYIQYKYTPEKIYRCVLLSFGHKSLDELLDTFGKVTFTDGMESLTESPTFSQSFLEAKADASNEASARREMPFKELGTHKEGTPLSKGAELLLSDASFELLPVEFSQEDFDVEFQEKFIEGITLKEHLPTDQLHLFSEENQQKIKSIEARIKEKELTDEEKIKKSKIKALEKLNRSLPVLEFSKLFDMDFNTAEFIIEKNNELHTTRPLHAQKIAEIESLKLQSSELSKKIEKDLKEQESLVETPQNEADKKDLAEINKEIYFLGLEISKIEAKIRRYEQLLETAWTYGKTTKPYGGGKTNEFMEEDYQLYDKSELEFNKSPTEELYSYLCSTWYIVSDEVKTPFMNRNMQEKIYENIITLLHKKKNDVLCDIYLTHYDRHEEPLLKDGLTLIYNYLFSNNIYVPLERDERPIYSYKQLLVDCLKKKIKYMNEEANEQVFDNVYGNILCVQIFGSPITILINNLSNGILPIPYGIQTHLYPDPFYPETFFYIFNLLKCILLTVPNCVSLSIYFSYLNCLLGESFLHNLYTDSSFSLLQRIDSHYFDKLYELQKNKTFTGPSNYKYDYSTDRLILNVPLAVTLPEKVLNVPLAVTLPEKKVLPTYLHLPVNASIGVPAGGTRRRKYKSKRYRTLSKRFKKNKTRRLH